MMTDQDPLHGEWPNSFDVNESVEACVWLLFSVHVQSEIFTYSHPVTQIIFRSLTAIPSLQHKVSQGHLAILRSPR